jgi:hypothetical protein
MTTLSNDQLLLLKQVHDDGTHTLRGMRDHRPFADLEERGLLTHLSVNLETVEYKITDQGARVLVELGLAPS